jgi:plastocyanin
VHRNYACGRHHGRDDLDCDDSGTGCDLEVKIDNFTFAPQRVTVKAGTTVTWINEDDILHTVASSTETFKSKALDTDDKFPFSATSELFGKSLAFAPSSAFIREISYNRRNTRRGGGFDGKWNMLRQRQLRAGERG